MRFVSASLLVLVCLGLVGCGGDSAAVGTWVIDSTAMEAHVAPLQAEADAGLKAMREKLASMPEAQRAMLQGMVDKAEAAAAEAAKDKNPFAAMEATLSGDGTYTVSNKGKVEVRGTWNLDGAKISFTETEVNGRKVDKPTTRAGTLKGDRITYKPDDNAPFELVFKKK